LFGENVMRRFGIFAHIDIQAMLCLCVHPAYAQPAASPAPAASSAQRFAWSC
jgi:hypothetical protein